VTADLEVHINRMFPNSIEFEETPIEVSGSFGIILYNHGGPCHVYLHLSDELADFAHMGVSNRFLKDRENVRLDVKVGEGAPETEGVIKIVTGHGSETAYSNVVVRDARDTRGQIKIDERLSIPKPKIVDSDPVVPTGKIPLIALMMVAVTMAAASLAIIQNWVIIIGTIVIALGVYIAYQMIKR